MQQAGEPSKPESEQSSGMAGIEISKRLIYVNSVSTVLKSVLTLSVFLWLQRYLVQNVRAEEYEVLAIVYPLLLYTPFLITWVTSGLARYVIEAYAQGDRDRVTSIVSTMFPLTLGVGTLVLLVGSVLAWKIDVVLDIAPEYVADARFMFFLLVLPNAARTIVMPFMVGLEIKQKYLFMNVAGLVLEIVRITILFLLLFGVSPRVLWVPVAAVPMGLVEIAIFCTLSCRLVPELRFRWSAVRREHIGPIVSFGGWTGVARMSAVVREMAAPLLLNRLSIPVEVGGYRLGSFVERRFYPVVLGPLRTMQTALTAMHATGQEERLRRYYFKLSRYMLWIVLFFATPAIVYRDELWTLYLGPQKASEYAAAPLVMALLFTKFLFLFGQPVLAQVALAKAEARTMAMRVTVIELSSVTATAIVLWLGGGAVGAALALVGASAIGGPLCYWTLGLRLTDARMGDFLRETLGRGLIPTAFALPVWVGAWLVAPPAGWLALAGYSALGAAVYAGVLLGFCLDPYERADFKKALRLK